MDPDGAPGDSLLPEALGVTSGPEPGSIVFLTGQTMGLLLLLLPLLVLLTAALKLRRSDDGRILHMSLAISSGAASLLGAVTTVAPGAIPDPVRDQGLLSFTWVFLFAWMTLDFWRSARRTGLRPRWSDSLVLGTAALLVLCVALMSARAWM